MKLLPCTFLEIGTVMDVTQLLYQPTNKQSSSEYWVSRVEDERESSNEYWEVKLPLCNQTAWQSGLWLRIWGCPLWRWSCQTVPVLTTNEPWGVSTPAGGPLGWKPPLQSQSSHPVAGLSPCLVLLGGIYHIDGVK